MLLAAVLIVSAGFSAWAEAEEDLGTLSWAFTGELNLAPSLVDESPRVYDRLSTLVDVRYGFLGLIGEMSLLNDLKYKPSEDYMLGRYFYLNNGGLELDFDFLSLRAGRLVHRDYIDSPYSLFISSEELPAVIAALSFQAGPFAYESRWIQLNTQSAWSYGERGANYKVFSLTLGEFSFGLQDAAVYLDRSFHLEYFLSPLPSIFVQMFTTADETPWKEDGDDNSIIGLFGTWNRSPLSLYAQWLVDDISLDFLIPWFLRDRFGERRIANKMAWALGGRWELPFGTLGFHHGGATKYTFGGLSGGTGVDDYVEGLYGYTYYPASEFQERPIDPADNYIGYKYGENNLAFMVEYAVGWPGVELYSNLEYVISGSKSPANPWHEHRSSYEAGRYTQLLNEPVLEHVISAEFGAAWTLRRWTLSGRLLLGGVFNRLALEPVADDAPGDPGAQQPVFRPQPGEHRFLYRLSLGLTYSLTAGLGRPAGPTR